MRNIVRVVVVLFAIQLAIASIALGALILELIKFRSIWDFIICIEVMIIITAAISGCFAFGFGAAIDHGPGKKVVDWLTRVLGGRARMINSYPLHWPAGWPRMESWKRKRAQFGTARNSTPGSDDLMAEINDAWRRAKEEL